MYQVRFYKGNYKWRQIQANRDDCDAYVEHHFNSSASPTSSYTLVITGYNASETSKKWGRWYANHIGQEFNVQVGGRNGILVGGFNGRGNGNVKYTNMPAILLEPLFASNPRSAELIRSTEGQDKLAKVLADSIIEFFPDGSLIGFSVGHKYKTSRPKDRGAPVYGGGFEADYAEIVMEKAKYILENYSPNQVEEEVIPEQEELIGANLRIIKDGEELWNYTDIDEDDYVYWDEENQVLYITSTGTSAQLF